MAAAGSMPSPQLLEEYSQFFRLLSEPARLQLLCLLLLLLLHPACLQRKDRPSIPVKMREA
jgi:DNA-binding transcriptional ArsR family regulator